MDERSTPLWQAGAGLVRRAGLRAGDRDRDAVATVLREQHLEGRLDGDEFQERLERALAAKTYGELDALVADLPVPEPAPPRPPLTAWLVPVLVAVLIVAVVVGSRGRAFWLMFPAFFFLRARIWRARGGPRRRRSMTTQI
jgi:hypothetical protein